jgi:DNA repair exonuclease SbcCD ATPase subunit
MTREPNCGHLAQIASGEARGLCPLCLRAEVERLKALIEEDTGTWQDLWKGERAEVERQRALCETRMQAVRELQAKVERLTAALIHTRTFLKTYQRSNAVWHNDAPTFDFIRTVIDPALEPKP